LDDGLIAPSSAVELGCGTGTNAVYLAQKMFRVTAIDCSALALQRARSRADDAGVSVEFLEADLCRFEADIGTFPFVFDRGCYHCARRVDLPGFLQTLCRVTQPGSKYLMLAGNANEQTGEGIPRLHEHEIRADLGALFEFDFIREIRFEDPGGIDGPLGWSCLMKRRDADAAI
jgi:ubiquinone/menaquinone biosynthesis C-methylase UbiE